MVNRQSPPALGNLCVSPCPRRRASTRALSEIATERPAAQYARRRDTRERLPSAVSSSVSQRSFGDVGGSTNGTSDGSRIQHHHQRVANDALAALVRLVDRVAVQSHAQAADVLRVPRLVGHLAARVIEPRDVGDVGAADAPALEELAPPQDRVLFPDPDQPPRELEEVALFAGESQCVQLISLSCAVARCCCRAACGRARRRR